MRKLTTLVTSVALVTAMSSSPAMAVVPPVQDNNGATPEEICEDQLRPNNPNSKFLTEPVNISVGGWVNDGPAYPGDPVGEPYGVGTPTYTEIDAGASGGFYRNGGSPNVWGTAVANLTVYPQTGQLYDMLVDQTRTTTFDCHVFKNPGGPDHGPDEISPNGLQSFGNSSVEHQEGVPAGGDPVEIVTNEPFEEPGATVVNTLICISPNNTTKGKPGDWRAKHGFTGSCTAASELAGTTFIPSNNNPTVD